MGFEITTADYADYTDYVVVGGWGLGVIEGENGCEIIKKERAYKFPVQQVLISEIAGTGPA